MPTITDLIQRHRDVTGETYRQMSDRAAGAGYHVKYQTIAELATAAPKGWPKSADTVAGLAAALNVSERVVVLAFARSLGIDVGPERSFLETYLPPEADQLPAESKNVLIRTIRSVVSAMTGRDNDADTSRSAARKRSTG